MFKRKLTIALGAAALAAGVAACGSSQQQQRAERLQRRQHHRSEAADGHHDGRRDRQADLPALPARPEPGLLQEVRRQHAALHRAERRCRCRDRHGLGAGRHGRGLVRAHDRLPGEGQGRHQRRAAERRSRANARCAPRGRRSPRPRSGRARPSASPTSARAPTSSRSTWRTAPGSPRAQFNRAAVGAGPTFVAALQHQPNRVRDDLAAHRGRRPDEGDRLHGHQPGHDERSAAGAGRRLPGRRGSRPGLLGQLAPEGDSSRGRRAGGHDALDRTPTARRRSRTRCRRRSSPTA